MTVSTGRHKIRMVNDKLANDPTLVSQDPYGAGWVMKVRVPSGTTLGHLMTPDQYQKQIESEAH